MTVSTCDGVQDLFGEGGVYGVAVFLGMRHGPLQTPGHTQVVPGTLGGRVQESTLTSQVRFSV